MTRELPVLLPGLADNRLFRWAVWLAFAVLFYHSGLTVTIALLEPEKLGGGLEWVWIAAFPVLVPLFFVVNGRFGCASGSCPVDRPGRGFRFPPGH